MVTILTPATGFRSTRYVNALGSSIFPGSLSTSFTTDIGTFSCPFDISELRILPSEEYDCFILTKLSNTKNSMDNFDFVS